MSRRKTHWIRHIIQAAGNIDKLFPQDVKGEGVWLVNADIPGKDFEVSLGTGKGNQVSKSMSQRKEELVRKWAKKVLS